MFWSTIEQFLYRQKLVKKLIVVKKSDLGIENLNQSKVGDGEFNQSLSLDKLSRDRRAESEK